MKSTSKLWLALSLIFVANITVASASDEWFGRSQPAANGTTTTSKSSWGSWMPWSSSKASRPATSNKPSTWTRMSQGTKSAWNKTTSFLNPFDNPPKQPPKSSFDERTGGWFSNPSSDTKSKSNDGKVTSVPEWLGGERPKF